ncbi:MAG: HAMP domain-containing protein [Actinobacteria bacterium]|nr:HAMP domain-containing protein [Actinomycetota bacterium]
MTFGALALVALVHQSLIVNLDASALTRARDVSALMINAATQSTLPTPVDGNSVVQVVNATNVVTSASANVLGEPPILSRNPSAIRDTFVTVQTLPIGSESQPFRVAIHPAALPGGPGWIYVATSLAQVDTATSTLSWTLAAAVPILIAIVALTIRSAVGRSLKPIESIRRQAAGIGSDSIQRVPVPESRDEVSRLAVTVNHMLDRLEASALKQKRFIGDASHELRSPLATLRAQVDVALNPLTESDALATLRSVQVQAVRMSSLIEDLLFLAHTDEGRERHDLEMVDLDEIVIEEFHRVEALGRVAVRLVGLQAVRTVGRRRDLARLVRNIGDNAVRHARSTVSISLSEVGGDAVIMIANDGTPIPAGDRRRIFDRFTRLDPARARSAATGDSGSGLGLAIASEIAASHGGQITTETPDSFDGAVFIVTLPKDVLE